MFKQLIVTMLVIALWLSNVVFAMYPEDKGYLGEIPEVRVYEPDTPDRDEPELILHEEFHSEMLNPNKELIEDTQFSFVSALNSKLSGIIQEEGRRAAGRDTPVILQPDSLIILPYDSMGLPLYYAEMELVVNGVRSVHQTQTGVFSVKDISAGSHVRFYITSEYGNFAPREIFNFNYELDGVQLSYAYDGAHISDVPAGIENIQTDNFSTAMTMTTSGSNFTISPMTAIGNEGFTVALRHDGTVWAWGDNHAGQLGIGTSGTATSSLTPVQVHTPNNMRSISSGDAHSISSRTDGTVWSWGSGSLGNGVSTMRVTPERVANLTQITTVSSGSQHNVARGSDGRVWTWGFNTFGALGNGTFTTNHRPTVADIDRVTAISAGSYHTLVRRNDGTVWAWGSGWIGQLGNGGTSHSPRPVQVRTNTNTNLTNIIMVAAGYTVSSALDNSGRVWIWGNGRTTAVQVQGLSNVRLITAAGSHVLAIRWDGTVWNVGGGTAVRVHEHDQGLYHITHISTGYNHTMAVRNDGRVLAWGGNLDGQLGDGTTISRPTPVQIVGSGGAGFFNLSALTQTINLNVSSGSHYSIPFTVRGVPIPKSFTLRFDPEKIAFVGMTGNVTTWQLPSHNPAHGVVSFSYYGSPVTHNLMRMGIINMLRFKALTTDNNVPIEIKAHHCFYD